MYELFALTKTDSPRDAGYLKTESETDSVTDFFQVSYRGIKFNSQIVNSSLIIDS